MRKDILDKKELVLLLISEKRSLSYISRELKCKHTTLNTYLKKMGIEYSGDKSGKYIKNRNNNKKPASYYLNDYVFIHSHKLKLKLIEDGIKSHECEKCNLSEWMCVKIPLELHHIDGNRFNNNLDNLQVLCPNCHSLTENNSGKKNKKRRYAQMW